MAPKNRVDDTEVSASHDLQTAIIRLSRRIKQNSADERTSEGQQSVLIHLYRRGPSTPGELSELRRVSAPSINRTINTLVEAGFVERVPSTEDRRNVMVTITESGRHLIAEMLSRRDAWIDVAMERLDPAERALLLDALPVLRKLGDR